MAERRPLVLVDGRFQELPIGDSVVGITSEEDTVYSKQTDFVGDTVIYKGEAIPGSLTSASVWRVRKLTLAGDGDVTEIWADGNANFDNVWDDRASLTYS